VIGKAGGDHFAEHQLDREIDLGHEIDAPLLVDAEVGSLLCHHHVARTDDRFERGRETRPTHERSATGRQARCASADRGPHPDR